MGPRLDPGTEKGRELENRFEVIQTEFGVQRLVMYQWGFLGFDVKVKRADDSGEFKLSEGAK